MTTFIAEVFEQELEEALNKSPYLSILVDVLINVIASEQKIIYILCLTETGETSCKFLQISDVPNATADGLCQNVIEVFLEMCVEDLHSKLVGICCDDASVDLGRHCGLAALFRADSHWLVVVHCMNDCIKLSIKDAFAQSYVEKIIIIMTIIYSTYERSSKRWKNLKYVAEVLSESVVKALGGHNISLL